MKNKKIGRPSTFTKEKLEELKKLVKADLKTTEIAKRLGYYGRVSFLRVIRAAGYDIETKRAVVKYKKPID